MTSMKEGTSAQLSGRGELHGGARVTTLVDLRKCTLGHKREIKTLKFVSASTKGFKGGLAWIKPSKKDMAVTFSYYGTLLGARRARQRVGHRRQQEWGAYSAMVTAVSRNGAPTARWSPPSAGRGRLQRLG